MPQQQHARIVDHRMRKRTPTQHPGATTNGQNTARYIRDVSPQIIIIGDCLARLANERASIGNLGLAVGATDPQQLSAMRNACPDVPFLIPGVGDQGGDVEAAVLHGIEAGGRPPIINSSRDVIYTSQGPDFAAAARYVATTLRDSINQILQQASLD